MYTKGHQVPAFKVNTKIDKLENNSQPPRDLYRHGILQTNSASTIAILEGCAKIVSNSLKTFSMTETVKELWTTTNENQRIFCYLLAHLPTELKARFRTSDESVKAADV
jgi:phage terminase large subunit-like protein